MDGQPTANQHETCHTNQRWVWPALFVVAVTPAFFDWRLWVLKQPPAPQPRRTPAIPTATEHNAIRAEVQDAWNELKSVLADHYPDLLTKLRGPASEEQINEIEAEIGFQFPPHYRASLLIHDGFDEQGQIVWLPQSVESALVATRTLLERNANQSLVHDEIYQRAWWHQRLFKISGSWRGSLHSRGHALNLETGEISWWIANRGFEPKSNHMAENLQRIVAQLKRWAR